MVLVSVQLRVHGIHQFSSGLDAVVVLIVSGMKPAVVKYQGLLPESLLLESSQAEAGHLAARNGAVGAEHIPVLHFVRRDGSDIARNDIPVSRGDENLVPGPQVGRGSIREIDGSYFRGQNGDVLAHGRVPNNQPLFPERDDFSAEAVIVFHHHIDGRDRPRVQQAGGGQEECKAYPIFHKWAGICS